MLKYTRKIIALSLMMCLIFTLKNFEYASAGEITQKPAADLATDKIEIKAFNNKEGLFKAERKITRIEFIKLINEIFGFTDKAKTEFKDIPAGAEYAEEVSKAVSAGYALGYKDMTFRPHVEINNQEAATILFRLMKLNISSDPIDTEKFKDLGKNPQWSRQIINTVVKAGYMTGYGDYFKPSQPVTWKEAGIMLNIVAGMLYNKEGSYGYGSDMEILEGNMTISSSNVKLANKTVKGDLFITPGVGDGSIELDNVKVSGRTIICGGGDGGILLNGSSLGQAIVDKNSGETLRIVAHARRTVGSMSIRSGVLLIEERVTGIAFGEINVDEGIKPGDNVEIEGDFTSININEPGVNIIIREESMVGTINLNARACIKGSGTIGTVNMFASGVTVEQKPGRINFKVDN